MHGHCHFSSSTSNISKAYQVKVIYIHVKVSEICAIYLDHRKDFLGKAFFLYTTTQELTGENIVMDLEVTFSSSCGSGSVYKYWSFRLRSHIIAVFDTTF
jgi:hypothetical protein